MGASSEKEIATRQSGVREVAIAVRAIMLSVTAKEEGTMNRERALKVVLVVVGVIFCALAYPLIMFVKQEPALAMQFSMYVTLGIFLLFASRNPSANRSLIAFTAWSSFVHAMLMAGQAFAGLIARGELIGSAVLVVIGIVLIALVPTKQGVERPSSVAA
jgi:hypothetical protein